MEGWIKLHRVLLEKPIWNCSNCLQKALLITLLLKANHKENEWVWKGEKYKLQPGQFITSAESLEKEIGKEASRQKIRSSLALFEKLGFLTIKTTNKNTLITIVNWELYQGGNDEDNQQFNNQITNKQPSNNHQITTNKNDKNIKNEKKKDILSKFDLFWREYPKKEAKQAALKSFTREVTSEEQADMILNSLRKQNQVWEKKGTGPDYIPLASTWLNQGRFNDEFDVILQGIRKTKNGSVGDRELSHAEQVAKGIIRVDERGRKIDDTSGSGPIIDIGKGDTWDDGY